MPATLTVPTGIPTNPTQLNPLQSGLPNLDPNPAANFKKMFIPTSVVWGTDDQAASVATGGIIYDLKQFVAEFGRPVALFIDNTQSGSDVAFLFPDCGMRVDAPAGFEGFVAIECQSSRFYLVNTTAIAGDTVFFGIYNFQPLPYTFGKTVFSSAAAIDLLSLTASSTTPLIAAPINGTITGLSIIAYNCVAPAGGPNGAAITIQDGAGNVIALTHVLMPGSSNEPSVPVYSQSSLGVRFTDGLKVIVTATGTPLTSGSIDVNVYYRTP